MLKAISLVIDGFKRISSTKHSYPVKISNPKNKIGPTVSLQNSLWNINQNYTVHVKQAQKQTSQQNRDQLTFSLVRSSSNISWISTLQSSCIEWKESCGMVAITASSMAVSCSKIEAKDGRMWGSCSQQSRSTKYVTILLVITITFHCWLQWDLFTPPATHSNMIPFMSRATDLGKVGMSNGTTKKCLTLRKWRASFGNNNQLKWRLCSGAELIYFNCKQDRTEWRNFTVLFDLCVKTY